MCPGNNGNGQWVGVACVDFSAIPVAVADVVQPRVEEITALMLLDGMMMQPSLKNYLFSIAHKRLMLIRISRVDMVAVVDAMVHARREWER